MTAMWLIDAASKKVQTEYFKVVFMKLFQFDTLLTPENDAQFSIISYIVANQVK